MLNMAAPWACAMDPSNAIAFFLEWSRIVYNAIACRLSKIATYIFLYTFDTRALLLCYYFLFYSLNLCICLLVDSLLRFSTISHSQGLYFQFLQPLVSITQLAIFEMHSVVSFPELGLNNCNLVLFCLAVLFKILCRKRSN